MSADARRRTSSRAWRRLAPALLIAAAAVTLLGQNSLGADGGSSPPATATTSTTTSRPCDNVRVGLCRTLTLPSGSAIRYAVVRPETAAKPTGTTPALIVDQGGPGTTAFGANWIGDNLHRQLPSRLRDRALLVLEEPWVTRAYPQTCQQALTAYFRWAHDGVDAPAPDVARPCQLWEGTASWGWTP
ncbi:MAG TPA: hypothetical protein VM097_12100, partial [Mycobacteriales bacterium]|nr:hypothetical protein [Mycobacteriales bacterium]